MDILASDEEDVADRVSTDDDIEKLVAYMKESLTPREMEIIIKRYGLGQRSYTQQEIAKKLNISRSYVSRIEKKALGILSKCFDRQK